MLEGEMHVAIEKGVLKERGSCWKIVVPEGKLIFCFLG